MPKKVKVKTYNVEGRINGDLVYKAKTDVYATFYTPERQALAKEVSRLASMANKRLKRLEQNIDIAMTSPSYRNFIQDGKGKFSVAGKDIQELKQEKQRVEQFLSNYTSTLRGAREYMNRMVDMIGLRNVNQYTGEQIGQAIQAYWKLQDMVSERLKLNEEMPYKYQKGFEVVGQAIQDSIGDIDLLDDLDNMVDDIVADYNELTKEDMETLGVLDVLL